jgi:hypothetical protein
MDSIGGCNSHLLDIGTPAYGPQGWHKVVLPAERTNEKPGRNTRPMCLSAYAFQSSTLAPILCSRLFLPHSQGHVVSR